MSQISIEGSETYFQLLPEMVLGQTALHGDRCAAPALGSTALEDLERWWPLAVCPSPNDRGQEVTLCLSHLSCRWNRVMTEPGSLTELL